MLRCSLFLLWCALSAVPLASQTAAERIAVGDSLHDALQAADALAAYKAALAVEPENAAVLWRAARSQVDLAKQIVGDHEYTRQVRDSVYAVARGFAERAIVADSTMADGYFALALVLGQLSRTKSGKERVTYGREIYEAAARALALEPDHDGAHHIIGAWHAEIKRLSGITRFFAKTFLGAGFMDRASWDSAAVHLERAVALNPSFIHHRLELAEIYVDLDRWADARAQLAAIPDLPDGDVLDPRYRETAAELLREIRDR